MRASRDVAASTDTRPSASRVHAALPFLAAIPVVVGLVLWSAFDGGYFGRIWYPSAIGAVLLLVGIALGTGRMLPESRQARIALLLLLGLLAWSVVSMLWAESPGSSLEAASKVLLVTALAWALTLLPWTPRSGMALLLSWSLGVAAVCALSLFNAMNAADLGEFLSKGRYMEPLGYANAAAALPTMAFVPAVLVACRASSPAALRVVLLAVATFLFQFALLPQSRGGLIAMAGASLVLLALAPDRVRLLLGLGVVVAVTSTSIGAIYHVYDVAIELSNAGLAPSEQIVGSAIDDAVRAIAIATGLAAAVGVGLVAVDRRLRPSMRTVRAVGVAGRVAVIAAALLGSVVLVANADRIYDTASDRWETFKSDKETPNIPGSRISANYSDQRYDYWRVAVEAFADEPLLGVGSGNYGRRYDAERRFGKPSRYPHNIWLLTLAEGGVVGVLLLVGFLAVALGGLMSVRRRGDADAALISAAALVTSVYFFVHASFDWLEQFPALAVPAFAFPLIALTATAVPTASRQAHVSRPTRHVRLRIAAGLALAGVALAALTIQYLALRYYERAGDWGASNSRAAFEDLERAADLNPLWIQPHLRAGALAVRVNDPARARASFHDALQVEPSWYAHLELGLLEAQVGRFRRARRQLELASALNASDEFLAEAWRRVRRRERIDPAAFNAAIQKRLRELLGSPAAGASAQR